MPNVWNTQLGRWEDPATGNFLQGGYGDPNTGQWIGGTWTNNSGAIFQNGTWINPNAPKTQNQYGGLGNINIPQGFGYQNQINQNAFTGQQNQLNNQAQLESTRLQTQNARELQQMQLQHQQQQNQLQRDFEQRQKQIDIEAQKYINEREIETRKLLQTQQITATEAENQKQRASQEAEFAKTLAFNQLELDRKMELANLQEAHQYEINQKGIDIQMGNQKLEERRVADQEKESALKQRELEASLGANPVNFVMNELYKRGATPGTLPQSANAAVTSVANAAGGNPNAPAQAVAATSGTIGQQPAYDDQTLAGIANNIFGGNTPGGLYNPKLGGTGIFGATIAAPNQVSRQQALNMTDTEKGILQSFLSAGVDMGNGQRTSIDPAEWWKQQQNSLVPTLDRNSSRTSYVV